jgi:hypothetical protein
MVPVYPRRRQVKRRAGMRGGKYIIPAPSHLQELQQEVNHYDDDDEPHHEPYYVLHVFSPLLLAGCLPCWTRAASS